MMLVLAAVSAVISGCATKRWVNELVGKERVQTDTRVAKVEQQVGEEGQRVTALDGRVGQESRRVDAVSEQVKGVGETADAARTLATGAQQRADQAFNKADETDGRLTRLWANRHKRSIVETTNVHFGFNRSELNDGAQTALLGIAEEMKKNPALAVALEGYADPRGTQAYNLDLSRRRVEAVRRYLVSRGIELWRIDAIGLGVLPAADVPAKEKRRVTITLVTPE
jgi:outer membrane protein OmpA-like peptidoglycan-associated protein